MIIFYSGSAGLSKVNPNSEPELILGKDAHFMLSYYLITNKQQDQQTRFPIIIAARKEKRLVNQDDYHPKERNK